MLKVIKASEPIEVKTIVMCVYAPPGVGKTSLASTASRPLLLDADLGAHRSRNRGDTVRVESWGDVASMKAEDFAGYDTIIADTAGRILDLLSVDIMREDPKAGRAGSLTLQGYGTLKGRFLGWVRALRSYGKDVIFVCHSDEQRKGDEVIERLDAQGSSKGEIYKSADAMGRIYLRDGARTLNFSPTDTAFGKNPTQLPVLTVPDFGVEPQYLAGVIKQIKGAMNKESAESVSVASQLAEVGAKIEAATTLGDFDAMLAEVLKAPEAIQLNAKRLLVKAAKIRGFGYNKDTKAFDLAAP